MSTDLLLDGNDTDLEEYHPYISLLSPTSKQIYKQWQMDANDELLIYGYSKTCNITEQHLSADILHTIALYYTKRHSKGFLKRKLIGLQIKRPKRSYSLILGALVTIVVFGIWWGADIAGLFVATNNDCDASIPGESQWVPFSVNTFLLYGCSVHLAMELVVLCSLFWLLLFAISHRHKHHYQHVGYEGCLRATVLCFGILFGLLSLSWSIIGCLLYSKMNQGTACANVTIAWICIRFIECVLLLPFILGVHWIVLREIMYN
eukprot:267894_1